MDASPTSLSRRRMKPARRLRRLFLRLGMIALAFGIVTLIVIGGEWLFVDAAASGIELGVAVRAADVGND